MSMKETMEFVDFLGAKKTDTSWDLLKCSQRQVTEVSFDIQPTNPQADITATGHCEYWITTIDLMKHQEKSTPSSPDDPMLP